MLKCDEGYLSEKLTGEHHVQYVLDGGGNQVSTATS